MTAIHVCVLLLCVLGALAALQPGLLSIDGDGPVHQENPLFDAQGDRIFPHMFRTWAQANSSLRVGDVVCVYVCMCMYVYVCVCVYVCV
jgi:hypothetical protein